VEAVRAAGWLGVDLFFVLSGFLVGGLVFDEVARTGGFAWGRFLVRRGLKIYPGYYVFLAVALGWISTGEPLAPRRVATEALFLQNYLPGYLLHTWSLAVEEHAYLLLVGSTVLALRLGGAAAVAGVALLWVPCAALGLLGRAQLTRLYEPNVAVHTVATHLRLEGIAAGVLLAWVHLHHRDALRAFVERRRLALALLAAALLGPIVALGLLDPRVLVLGLSASPVAFGAVVLLAVHAPPARGPARRLGALLAWVGRYSYSIYLWHFVAIAAADRWLLRGLPWPLVPLACVVVAVLLGALAAEVVELPALRLRDRLFPSRAAPLARP
jgi:peptidoglycan/LPS O-acetylase OafA/YrhL